MLKVWTPIAILLSGLFVILACDGGVGSQNPPEPPLPIEKDEQEAALSAAVEFLKKIDAGKAAASWEDLADLVKKSTPEKEWPGIVAGMRQDLGPLHDRWVDKIEFKKRVRGGTRGRYFVIEFRSEFEKNQFMERIVLRLRDDIWRIAGYTSDRRPIKSK